MHILYEMFAWPQGIVVGNLIASLIWGIPAFVHLHMRMNRHHRERNYELGKLYVWADLVTRAHTGNAGSPGIPGQEESDAAHERDAQQKEAGA